MIVPAEQARRMQAVRTTATFKVSMSIWDVQDMEWRSRTMKGRSNIFYADGQSFYIPGPGIEVERNYTVTLIKSFPEGHMYGSTYVPRDDELEPKNSATVLHVPYRGMLIRWPSENVELLKIVTLCGHKVRAAVRGEVEINGRMCKMCRKKLVNA